jgi:hypothetical protein
MRYLDGSRLPSPGASPLQRASSARFSAARTATAPRKTPHITSRLPLGEQAMQRFAVFFRMEPLTRFAIRQQLCDL